MRLRGAWQVFCTLAPNSLRAQILYQLFCRKGRNVPIVAQVCSYEPWEQFAILWCRCDVGGEGATLTQARHRAHLTACLDALNRLEGNFEDVQSIDLFIAGS
jgi:hypothetical protein